MSAYSRSFPNRAIHTAYHLSPPQAIERDAIAYLMCIARHWAQKGHHWLLFAYFLGHDVGAGAVLWFALEG